VPDAVRRLAGDGDVRPAWGHEFGLTWEVRRADRRLFVKWCPAGSPIDLSAEAARLRWAGAFTPVPTVIDEGGDKEGSWLLTSALPGENAVSDRWKAEPAVAVRAIGEGLRALHDRLPVGTCPFSWSVDERVAEACQRLARGQWRPEEWHAEHRGLDPAEILARLSDVPAIDKVVVCHGDTCAPNTLIDDDGRWSGHVDLGSLGLADRWADLAVATWSLDWNYGPGWDGLLLDVYGASADDERTAYYRLLWDVGP